jgi:hypothetical protein
MKKAHAIAMFERLAKEARRNPDHGYNRRGVFMESANICDAGSQSIVSYELNYRDVEAIIRMLKATP